MTDSGLAHLSELAGLRDLRLAGTAVTDAGLRTLGRLQRLERLDLGGTSVTEEGLLVFGERDLLRIERGKIRQPGRAMPVLNLFPPKADLRPLDNPFLLDPGDVLRIRASLDGVPLVGQTVWAYRGDGTRLVDAVESRTDREGVARLKLGSAGFWLVRFVHMQTAPEDAGVDWESYWACLAVEVD